MNTEDSPKDHAGSISRVLAGDLEAFRPLVVTYEPAVFGLCRKLLRGSADEAEDLTQETFIRAYRYLDRLKDPARFGPWLYRIARSLCRDRRRQQEAEKRALQRRVEALERTTGHAGAHEDLADPFSSESSELEAVLRQLPTVEQEVLNLRYCEGLCYREICERLGLRFSQVDHLMRKARSRLARRLEVRLLNDS